MSAILKIDYKVEVQKRAGRCSEIEKRNLESIIQMVEQGDNGDLHRTIVNKQASSGFQLTNQEAMFW